MKSSTYYFYMRTKILADFHICISVPLRKLIDSSTRYCFAKFQNIPHGLKMLKFAGLDSVKYIPGGIEEEKHSLLN